MLLPEFMEFADEPLEPVGLPVKLLPSDVVPGVFVVLVPGVRVVLLLVVLLLPDWLMELAEEPVEPVGLPVKLLPSDVVPGAGVRLVVSAAWTAKTLAMEKAAAAAVMTLLDTFMMNLLMNKLMSECQLARHV